MADAICTADKPWDGVTRGVRHPDAREVCGSQRDGYPAGDEVDYRCPHCGETFTVELPQ